MSSGINASKKPRYAAINTLEYNEMEKANRLSESGRLWKWCDDRGCWQFDEYRYRIIRHADGIFGGMKYGVWLDDQFASFDEAETGLEIE